MSEMVCCCRKIWWSVVGGEVHIGYQRRLMRCSINTTLYRYCAWQAAVHSNPFSKLCRARKRHGRCTQFALATLACTAAGCTCWTAMPWLSTPRRCAEVKSFVHHSQHTCSNSRQDRLSQSSCFRCSALQPKHVGLRCSAMHCAGCAHPAAAGRSAACACAAGHECGICPCVGLRCQVRCRCGSAVERQHHAG